MDLDILERIWNFAYDLSVRNRIALLLLLITVFWFFMWATYRFTSTYFKRQVELLRDELRRTGIELMRYLAELGEKDSEIERLRKSAAQGGNGSAPSTQCETLLDTQRIISGSNVDLWSLRPAQIPDFLSERLSTGPKIITVGNLKGGVGKTTLAANLAAYFDVKREKRVLTIDLDYQGSLTATLLQAAQKGINTSLAELFLTAHNNVDALRFVNELRPLLKRTHHVPAGYTLAALEEKLMAKWIYHLSDTDVRFNLAELLTTPEVKEKYDVIIIDVGPRLTTASIAALCASTHLIVPTNLDKLSAETVGSFLNRVWALKKELKLPLKLAGVVGTLTLKTTLSGEEQDALTAVNNGRLEWKDDGYVFDTTIHRTETLSKIAGSNIGYLIPGSGGVNMRKLFNTLGDEISGRIGL